MLLKMHAVAQESVLCLTLVTAADIKNDEGEVSTFLDEEVTAMLRGSGELIRQNEWRGPEGHKCNYQQNERPKKR